MPSSGFERDNFFSLSNFLYSREYLGSLHLGTTDGGVVFSTYHKYFVDADLCTHFVMNLLYHHAVVLHHFMLAVAYP